MENIIGTYCNTCRLPYCICEIKHPKQVEEIEAVEFVEWTNDLIKCDYYPVYNEKTNKLSYWENRKNYTKITTKQLYEIFKNQK